MFTFTEEFHEQTELQLGIDDREAKQLILEVNGAFISNNVYFINHESSNHITKMVANQKAGKIGARRNTMGYRATSNYDHQPTIRGSRPPARGDTRPEWQSRFSGAQQRPERRNSTADSSFNRSFSGERSRMYDK